VAVKKSAKVDVLIKYLYDISEEGHGKRLEEDPNQF
jgi:hypothetical protein